MRVIYFGNLTTRILNMNFVDSNVALLYREPWQLAGTLASECSGLPHSGDSTSGNAYNAYWSCSVLMGLQAAAEYGLPAGTAGIAGSVLATFHGCFLSHTLVHLWLVSQGLGVRD